VRGFKLDYGETMRPNLLTLENQAVAFSDGSTAQVQHTRYARLYHEAFKGVLDEVHPDDNFIITRTGGIYDQQNGVALWPGDLDNDFREAGVADPDSPDELAVGGLPAAVRGAVSSSVSGYMLYGSDIGGYRGGASSAEVYRRWIAAGAFQTIMQLGGGGTGDTTHNPWETLPDGTYRYGEDAVDIYRRYATLRMQLLPLWREALRRASTDGTPPLIPLGAIYPDDGRAWDDDFAYRIGGGLVVFPEVHGEQARSVYLPRAHLDFTTGVRFEQGEHSIDVGRDGLPLFVEPGTALVLLDPRVQTAVNDAGPNVNDLSTHGALRIIRAYLSTEDVRYRFDYAREGLSVELTGTQASGSVDVLSDGPRPFVVQMMGPASLSAAGLTLSTDRKVRALTDVSSEVALYDCESACRYISEHGVFVATSSARELTVTMQ